MEARYEPYHIYKRDRKNGKPVYYARFINQDTGEILKTLSTRQTSQKKAIQWAEGKLPEIEAEKSLEKQRAIPTLSAYAEGFFNDDGPYRKARERRGYRVAENYLYTCRSYVKTQVADAWGAYRIDRLTVETIEHELINLFQKGKASPSTVNRALRVLRLILDGAVLDGILQSNPAARVKPVHEKRKERGTFSLPEMNKLFKDSSLWPSLNHYTLNLLAATSGLRLGEIRGLCLEHYHQSHISVQLQWCDREGLKPPKADSIRDIPIPEITQKALDFYITEWKPERIIFYATDGKDRPLTKSHIEKQLYRTLEKIGIEAGQRKERCLVFHSWRHTLNTLLRSRGIADSKIRKVTGHRSDQMTNQYTHFTHGDLEELSTITGSITDALPARMGE